MVFLFLFYKTEKLVFSENKNEFSRLFKIIFKIENVLGYKIGTNFNEIIFLIIYLI